MITVSQLTKSFGDQILFSEVSISIGAQEKIGIIGRNGSGKSTFLKLLLQEDSYDSGRIEIPSAVHISALEQHLQLNATSVLEQVTLALPKSEQNQHWRAESVLLGLGFTVEDCKRSPKEFSSGMQVRIRLAAALVNPAQLLLLDEPTNYLDITSLRWLERFLQQWNQAFVLVTHDQQFMEKVITHTIAIHRGKMRKMKGGPTKILAQIVKDEEVQENTRINTEKKQEKTKEFIRKFRAGARSAGLVQSRIKALEKQKKPEKLEKLPQISFQFAGLDIRANSLIEATNIQFSYNELPLIPSVTCKVYAQDRLAIVGPNGKGKSTMLRLLTKKIQPQSGTIKHHADVHFGYFSADTIKDLNTNTTIIEELLRLPNVTETQVRSVCGALLFSGDTVKKHISTLSGGEKSRVCFAKVLLSPCHVLVLDEPTNHLDLESCQALTKALKEFIGTVIFVTHDEKILTEVATRLLVFDDDQVRLYEKTYREFLQDVGWKQEKIEEAEIHESKNKVDYKRTKELRRNLRKNQSDQEKLLLHIEKLESKQLVLSKEMQAAYDSSDSSAIETLGREAKHLADQIAESLQQLDTLILAESSMSTNV